jgi:carboxyl-terminal processing protease
VVGGGGILPDVVVGDSTVPPAERAWVAAVGSRVLPFRDILSTFAAKVVRSGVVKDPDFKVTPEMRDEFWRAMKAKNLVIPRDVFDDAHDAIDRVVGAEIAQQAFGIAGAQRRAVHLDPVVAHAVQMLHGVTAPKVLFDRIASTNAAVKPLAER